MIFFEKHFIFALKKIPLELFGYRKSAKKESGGGVGVVGERVLKIGGLPKTTIESQ
jgi:hypothetical protein